MLYCPKCGKQVSETANFCLACGYHLKDEQLEQAQPEAKGQPSKCDMHPARNSVGVCSNCGRAVCDMCWTAVAGKLFCSSCLGKTTILPTTGTDRKEEASFAKTPNQKIEMEKNYQMEILQPVVKALDKIPDRDRAKIISIIASLTNNPRPLGCKKHPREEKYIIEEGKYRIWYSIEGITVQVLKVWKSSPFEMTRILGNIYR